MGRRGPFVHRALYLRLITSSPWWSSAAEGSELRVPCRPEYVARFGGRLWLELAVTVTDTGTGTGTVTVAVAGGARHRTPRPHARHAHDTRANSSHLTAAMGGCRVVHPPLGSCVCLAAVYTLGWLDTSPRYVVLVVLLGRSGVRAQTPLVPPYGFVNPRSIHHCDYIATSIFSQLLIYIAYICFAYTPPAYVSTLNSNTRI